MYKNVHLFGLLVSAFGFYGSYIVYCLIRKSKIKNVIVKKQNELNLKKSQLLEQLDDIRKSEIDEITNLSLNQLLYKIQNGELKPIYILRVYQLHALQLNNELNFIIDINTSCEDDLEAITDLESLPLKGIPVSIKDSFFVRNCDCTWGIPHFINERCDKEFSLVDVIRKVGGVPFVVTNMCQTGKSIESSNPIVGCTTNPYDSTRTSGGSSGGEGAIIGGKASIIGLGGDIGGSIRIPSTFCGIYGLKPSSSRLLCRHGRKKTEQDIIQSTAGPMARSIDDLIYFFKLLTGPELHKVSPYCAPLLFNENLFNKSKSLKIGMYTHLGGAHIEPIPAVKRAVSLAKAALIKAGHTIVEYQLPDVDYGYNLFLQVMLNDGGVGALNDLIVNDPVDKTIRLTINLIRAPIFLKSILSTLLWPFSPKHAAILKAFCGVSSPYGVWQLKRYINEYREKILQDWEEKGLDGLICPVMPIAAPLLNTTSTILDVSAYTAMFNLLDYPAGSVPVTHVNKADQDAMKHEYPDRASLSHTQIYKDHIGSSNHTSVKGMPIGVQCVSKVWREEVCLRIMKDLADNL